MSEPLPERAGTVVIGAGAVGLAVAYELARARRDVLVLDRGLPGEGTSWGNCGLITPSYADPQTQPASLAIWARSLFDASAPIHVAPTLDLDRWRWLARFAAHCTPGHRERARRARWALLRSSRDLLARTIEDEKIDCDWVPGGVTILYRSQAALDAHLVAHRPDVAAGLSLEVLTGDQARAREPRLRREVVGAIRFPGDGHLEPGRLGSELARAAAAHGARIATGVEVEGIDAARGRVGGVRTARGTVRAETVVLAAGPWAPRLAQGLGLRLPLQPAKGYSITWPCPIEGIRGPLCFNERKVVLTPWPASFRLGSTIEFAGYDERLNRLRLSRLIEGARLYVDDAFEHLGGREWYGWRPMSVDEVPIIGPSKRIAGLHFACGHGQLGVSMCSATGRLVAEQLQGAPPHLDPAPYAPARFGL